MLKPPSTVPHTASPAEAEPLPGQEIDSTTQAPKSRTWFTPWKEMLRQRGWPTLRYLAKTEAHTFAFSVAANAILSFFPFVLLLSWLVRSVFHSETMFAVIQDLLRSQLPTGQDFVVRNLDFLTRHRHSVRIISVVAMLISSSGVFLPLEVAFNGIWGFAKNRSYLGNQFISFLLAFACGTLGLLSVGMAAGNRLFLSFLMGGNEDNLIFKVVVWVLMKIFAMIASVGIFFLIYWVLPNGRVSARTVLRTAIAVGIVWEAAKYIYILLLPWLNFQDVYGPFAISVTLMVWAFVSGLLVLAGAHLAATPITNGSPLQTACG